MAQVSSPLAVCSSERALGGAGKVAKRSVRSVGLSDALVGDMSVHSVAAVQGIRRARTVFKASVPPTRAWERASVGKPRVAVIAGHDLVDVDVGGHARQRGESGGQSNDDREKGFFHDRLDLGELEITTGDDYVRIPDQLSNPGAR